MLKNGREANLWLKKRDDTFILSRVATVKHSKSTRSGAGPGGEGRGLKRAPAVPRPLLPLAGKARAACRARTQPAPHSLLPPQARFSPGLSQPALRPSLGPVSVGP